MKKLLVAVLAAVLFASSAFGAGLKTGILSLTNMSSEEFAKFTESHFANEGGWRLLDKNHGSEDIFVAFDSLASMMMALHSDKVDEVALPETIAEYVKATDAGVEVTCAIRSRVTYLALGFRNDEAGQKLCARVNEALSAMRANSSLNSLTSKYLDQPGRTIPAAEAFAEFPGAETLKVAITGDLPPLDMIASDGKPVGFNTAVLSEIGRKLGVNIELVNVDAGARTSALMSGRVDVVFWYHIWQDVEKQPDVVDGILLSEPYYGWDTALHLRNLRR